MCNRQMLLLFKRNVQIMGNTLTRNHSIPFRFNQLFVQCPDEFNKIFYLKIFPSENLLMKKGYVRPNIYFYTT